MNKAYFYKVDSTTTWTSLTYKTYQSIILHRKPLLYNCICKIFLNKIEFDSVCQKIYNVTPFCYKYYHMSITDYNGIHNCIEVLCKSNSNKIIIYTAGELFPLYAAISSN